MTSSAGLPSSSCTYRSVLRVMRCSRPSGVQPWVTLVCNWTSLANTTPDKPPVKVSPANCTKGSSRPLVSPPNKKPLSVFAAISTIKSLASGVVGSRWTKAVNAARDPVLVFESNRGGRTLPLNTWKVSGLNSPSIIEIAGSSVYSTPVAQIECPVVPTHCAIPVRVFSKSSIAAACRAKLLVM